MTNLKINLNLETLSIKQNYQKATEVLSLSEYIVVQKGSIKIYFGKEMVIIQELNLYKLHYNLWEQLSKILNFVKPRSVMTGMQAYYFGLLEDYLHEYYSTTEYGFFELDFLTSRDNYYWTFLYHPSSDEVKVLSHNNPKEYLICSKKQLAIQLYKLYLALVQDIRKQCYKAFWIKDIMQDYEDWKATMKTYKKAIEAL